MAANVSGVISGAAATQQAEVMKARLEREMLAIAVFLIDG